MSQDSYAPPEIYECLLCEEQEYPSFDGFTIDVWALGCILFAFLTRGLRPWENPKRNGNRKFDCFMSGRIDNWVACFYTGKEEEREHAREIGFVTPNFFSPACLDLMKKICVYDPRKRLSLEQVLDHHWMNPQENNANDRGNNNHFPEDADGKHVQCIRYKFSPCLMYVI